MVQISFSVFAISVLGGLLASSVRLRLTSLESSPPKTVMAHTEKDIFTFRNNLTVFLWHQKTITSAVGPRNTIKECFVKGKSGEEIKKTEHIQHINTRTVC